MMDAVWILGAGRSGLAAAEHLRRLGRSGITLSETAPGENELNRLRALGFPWHPELPAGAATEAILSPGFRPGHPWVRALQDRGVPMLPEFERGARALRGRVMAITGSLGKTTMATLAHRIFQACGLRATLSGNIGVPVCHIADTDAEADWHVMELSSFQLEQSNAFSPDIAICLNLLPNHLDAHGSFHAYVQAKLRLFAHLKPGALAVLPPGMEGSPAGAEGWHWAPGGIFQGAECRLSLCGSPLDREVPGVNLALLWAAMHPLGLDRETVERCLREFQALPHRMERIPLADGGVAINDSKATCLAAARAALGATEGRVHWIAGGLGKQENPDSLKELLSARGINVYLVGASAASWQDAWRDSAPFCENVGNLENAMRVLEERRRPGETILLSPGCASFDQFRNFESRGDAFRSLIRAMETRTTLTKEMKTP